MGKPASAKRRPRSWDPDLPIEDRGPEAMLTPREAASYLGRSERWILRAVATREITYYKVGGSNRFRKADLDAYIESRRVPAKGEQ